jgi:hypothetical protein
MFDQVDIDYPVIVQPESFTKSVLSDFETSIEVPFQWGSEVEIKIKSQIALT